MSVYDQFRDFDDEGVYAESQSLAVDESTHNFVIEFGKDEAWIAFDLSAEHIRTIVSEERSAERPVRWINIWAPNQQVETVELLGSHYKFSPRLLAIIQSVPEFEHQPKEDVHISRFKRTHPKDDLEVASKSVDSPTVVSTQMIPNTTSHYAIAKQMVSYQSVDVGPHFLCIGANWMHQASKAKRNSDDSIVSIAPHQRLWSWLVICDDHTVITLHEDPGKVNDLEEIKSMRGNTLSVLSQLSNHGHLGADPVSMQSVRQALELGASQAHPGVEGASNLFYYLFDDWRAVYASISVFHKKLEDLQTLILGDLSRKSNTTPDITIIPRLHMLGREIRVKQHLYEGYHNLIQRILEPKSGASHAHGTTTPMSLSIPKGVVLAKSANQRFERLGDRLQLLILSEIQEFLMEKEALISTYFNINAQKDSEATARLTRSATLLAKLSVLFLPVSLMTSYFSVQIQDLQGVYTSKTYWTAFAIIMSVSFALVFLLSKSLMWVTETLDAWMKSLMKTCKRVVLRERSQE